MQPTNQPRTQKSRCTFCGSVDRGKGCRFGPHGVHFHPDDTTKCAYCGSPDYGKGCRLNPTSNLHVHGAVYNSMYKESVQSFLDNIVLLKELKKSYTEFECFKLGVIDEHGNKTKNPQTTQEHLSYTPFVKTILRLKKYLGAKIELIEASEVLGNAAITAHVDNNVDHYKKVLGYQERFDLIINDLYKTLDEAQHDGLPFEDIKKILKA